MNLSRRNFVQGVVLGGAALGAVGVSQGRRPMPPLPQMADVSSFTPPSAILNSQSLALGKIFPTLLDPDAIEGPFIANTLPRKDSSAGSIPRAEPGNSIFLSKTHAPPTIPAHPCSSRRTTLFQSPPPL